MKRFFRRCGHTPGALSPKGQVVVDAFRATLAALRNPEPWTPGRCQDVAVRVGPFIKRAHTRPGDDYRPDLIAVALVDPDTPHAAAYAHRYSRKGWLRRETSKILGVWNPAYAMLTHFATGLDLPDDVGMAPANYGVHVEARKPDNTGYILLRRGPSGAQPLGSAPWVPTARAPRTRRPLPRCAGSIRKHRTSITRAVPRGRADPPEPLSRASATSSNSIAAATETAARAEVPRTQERSSMAQAHRATAMMAVPTAMEIRTRLVTDSAGSSSGANASMVLKTKVKTATTRAWPASTIAVAA
jgi:hypothetical protein